MQPPTTTKHILRGEFTGEITDLRHSGARPLLYRGARKSTATANRASLHLQRFAAWRTQCPSDRALSRDAVVPESAPVVPGGAPFVKAVFCGGCSWSALERQKHTRSGQEGHQASLTFLRLYHFYPLVPSTMYTTTKRNNSQSLPVQPPPLQPKKTEPKTSLSTTSHAPPPSRPAFAKAETRRRNADASSSEGDQSHSDQATNQRRHCQVRRQPAQS